jgi:hypothetical protein
MMMERRIGMAVFVVAIAAQAGCAMAVVEPGLANAPALPLAVTIDVHDAIANGHDSCPRARVAAGDPLHYRYPPCPGREIAPPNMALLTAPVILAEPTDELWNLHLRGLPPCEGGRAARSNEFALALCRPD